MTSARGADGCERGRRPALARANRPWTFGFLGLRRPHACLAERSAFKTEGHAAWRGNRSLSGPGTITSFAAAIRTRAPGRSAHSRSEINQAPQSRHPRNG